LIIDRHLLRQIALPFISVLVVLLIIFVGYSLSRFLTQADAGLLNTEEVVRLTMLKVLIALEVLLPIGLYFGLMLGLGKLHNDSEIVALHAGGISEARLVRPVATLAIPLAFLIAFISLYVRPWAYTQTYEMLAIAEASSDIDRIRAGQFYLTRKSPAVASDAIVGAGVVAEAANPGRDRERAIFIERISPQKELEDVFIRTRTGEDLQVISSRTGRLVEHPETEFHSLELEQARLYKRVEDGPDLIARFDNFTLQVAKKSPEAPAYKAKSVASARLANSPNPKDQAEYQWRLSTPVTTLLLALLALPLSRTRPRHGRYARLLLAFVIYAAYYNLIEVSQTWVKQQTATSIWWTPLLLAAVVVVFYLPWRRLRFVLLERRRD
jgi:lipopolysaccharide export system permease protein